MLSLRFRPNNLGSRSFNTNEIEQLCLQPTLRRSWARACPAMYSLSCTTNCCAPKRDRFSLPVYPRELIPCNQNVIPASRCDVCFRSFGPWLLFNFRRGQELEDSINTYPRKNQPRWAGLFVVRVGRIELPSRVWKTHILTVVLYPLEVPTIIPIFLSLSSSVIIPSAPR